MKLIKLLQEASSLSLADIKKTMLKDNKVASVFKKELSLSDISDVPGFVSSLKFYIFNNSNVMDFVAKRHDVKYLNKMVFDRLRSLKSSELDSDSLEEIRGFLTDLFKEHTSVQKGIMSPALKKELADWTDSHSRYHNLSKSAVRELRSNPNFKPSKKMVVYRGVLFKESDLRSRKDFDGTLSDGNGLKFLKSIRKGSKVVDLTWDRPSSWTTDKSIAERFAKFGPASSHFAAMSNWFDREANKREIDGDLGYVISTLVDPKDVLLDTNTMSTNLASRDYGESEVILEAGTYLVKIVKKFNIKGEVDLDAEEVTSNPVNSVVRYIKKEIDSLSIPEQFASEKFSEATGSFNVMNVLKSQSITRMLITSAATTLALHLHDKLSELYKKSGLVDLTEADFSADKFNSDEEIKNAGTIRQARKAANQEITHAGKKHKRHNLSADDYRTTLKDTSLAYLEKDLLTKGVISRQAEYIFTDITRALSVSVPPSFYQMGPTKQKPIIDETIKSFLEVMGLPFNEESNTENYKAFVNFSKKLIRNITMIKDSTDKINDLRSLV